MGATIDFNCDLGEGADDEAVLPFISSASIACGFHAGDALLMRRTVLACQRHGVAVGAHPSYLDREGFGRRAQPLDADEIHALVLYQVGALAAIAAAVDVPLCHVKPHGALYNRAAVDREAADAIASAVRSVDRQLLLYGLAGSQLMAAAQAAGLGAVSEAFVERRYEADGSLSPRGVPGAVIGTIDEALAQMQQLLRGTVSARSGETIPIRADSICLHGDRPDAGVFARALRQALQQAQVDVRAPAMPVTDRHGAQR